MAWEHYVKALQVAAAALGIPAAAAGTYTAYQTFFSNEGICHQLRGAILTTMEKNVPAETKHALLRKDVADFDQRCGNNDPDARAIFQAAFQGADPSPAAPRATATAQSSTAASSPGKPASPIGIFGAPGAGEPRGWVALSRRDEKNSSWIYNFGGYAISEASLPPAGTVLTAQRMLPVWSEIQVGGNDQSQLRSRLQLGACVRVVTARAGTGRLWAEVVPTQCS
jgi:hypothetical protein